jgi:hypothetical protein
MKENPRADGGASPIVPFTSVAELQDARRRAEAAHGEHERRIGASDEDWPDRYAEYMVREQAGEELPT